MERRVGFVGCYSHDVILLLAKVLSCMEKRVLLTDRNKRHTLRASVPVPEGVCAEYEKVEYDGIFYSEQESRQEERERYDIEFIDFGMELSRKEALQCTEIIVVTDVLLHHIRSLAKEKFPKERVRVCVIRDVVDTSYQRSRELRDFLQTFPNRIEFFLPPDYRDTKNRYVCEVMYEYNIKRASPEMREMVLRMAGIFCPAYSEREIWQKVRTQERRRYR